MIRFIKNFPGSVNILVLIISPRSAYQKTVRQESCWGPIFFDREQPQLLEGAPATSQNRPNGSPRLAEPC